ncbi:MAG: carbamoyltransferase HypF [Pseudomonadota bacterium]|jgi:hydrogenase maturation protein HypF
MLKECEFVLSGQVQGVGFRPFIFRLAQHYDLQGWVQNRVGQVVILAQGTTDNLKRFLVDLIDKCPPLAKPYLKSEEWRDISSLLNDFKILHSLTNGETQVHVPPDYFTCSECLSELNDPLDRRFEYPFINCTQCGPRYTLIKKLPYDRPNTSMADFPLCENCRAEYENPLNRRFHAQPVACPNCGPQIQFLDKKAKEALDLAILALQNGKILAVKGMGGYHLICDATNHQAIQILREKKPRPHKPLAIMTLAVDLPIDQSDFLQSPLRPILLVDKKEFSDLSEHIAPHLNEIGVMLPYSPLHYLLIQKLGKPIIATSANISGEPVLTENSDVEQKLSHIAEGFVHHNRPIERPADDPVFRWIADAPRPLRLGRGNAPLELDLYRKLPYPVLAVGGHNKNTLCFAWENRAVISPHIGDLNSPRSLSVFSQLIENYQQLYQISPKKILCDAHPNYASTRWAMKSGLPVQKIYHHQAHSFALIGEINRENSLIFSWDGVGFGEDGNLWGGETFYYSKSSVQRVATLKSFRLMGGESVSKQIWRSAAALCWESNFPFETEEMVFQAWKKNLNCQTTHAIGRLFDGAAVLLGLLRETSFEGQAPMYLEAIAEKNTYAMDLPLLEKNGLLEIDWSPLIPMLLDQNKTISQRAGIFHQSLAQTIVKITKNLSQKLEINYVGLCGGVFQNKLLTELALMYLKEAGFETFFPSKIPINDAGLSFGQVMAYLHQIKG